MRLYNSNGGKFQSPTIYTTIFKTTSFNKINKEYSFLFTQIHFEATENHLTNTIIHDGYPDVHYQIIDEINILGINHYDISQVIVNGSPISTFKFSNGRLQMWQLEVYIAKQFTIEYS